MKEWGTGVIAMYATSKKSRWYAKHKIVIYIAADLDWESKHLERNGHKGRALALALMSPELHEVHKQFWRAQSWQYSGKPPQDCIGLAEDMRSFGYNNITIQRFVEVAKIYLEDDK